MIIKPDNSTEAGRAAAAIPGLREAVERLDALRAPLPVAVAETPTEIRDAVLADVVAGQPVDFIAAAERAVDAEHAVRVAQGARDLREWARERVEDRAEMLIAHGVDAALAVLAESLDDVLDKAGAAVALLGPVRTAQDALRAGETERQAYSTLDQLAARYGALRQAQRRFVGTVWDQGTLPTTLVAYGELRGRDALWTTHTPSGSPTAAPPPWPHTPGREQDGLSVNVETMIWLVTDERAEPWVPSIDQLHEEISAAAERHTQRLAEDQTQGAWAAAKAKAVR